MKQPNDVFNDFQARMSELLKNSPAKDVERNVKAMLSQGFSKLDLVTREEFDTQTQVLVRTRARLEELERRVARARSRSCTARRKRRKTVARGCSSRAVLHITASEP